MTAQRWWCLLIASLLAVPACSSNPARDRAAATTTTVAGSPARSPLFDLPLPPPVSVRQDPEGVALADPAFEPLPGARADFGTLAGAAYQIEIPDAWNGSLVLWMHGFEEFAPEAKATPPDFRRYLISHGFAWGASSFSSTSLIPGRSADETAALWDYFVREHGRPSWTYAAGLSMGGWSAHITAERYGDRFNGALGLCGAAGTTPGLWVSAELLVVGAFVAGVTQSEFDATQSIEDLIEQRIQPALDDPAKHMLFENIMIDLTGGPRAFAREGLHLEEETNWRRAGVLVAAQLAPQRDEPYELGLDAGVTSEEFNRNAIELPTNDAAFSAFSEGMDVSGDVQMPLVTLHTTGDGQVPIEQAQILRERVHTAGRGSRLVQRVIEDPGHCGFTTSEQEAAFAALVEWVEGGDEPAGTDLDVDDLTSLDQTFELAPRPGAADDQDAAKARAVVSGSARLDGDAFDARWIGAVVLDDQLVTPCQYTLPPVDGGQFEITVYGERESAGCGRPGAGILLWTFVDDEKLFTTEAIPWPDDGTADVTVDFATSEPAGAAPATTDFSGEVYRSDGERAPTGSLVEAYVDDTLCGVASIRGSGSFIGYILSVVGPDSVPGCRSGEPVTFRVDGARVVESATNSPGASAHLDLTVT